MENSSYYQQDRTHADWIFLSPHPDDAALSCGGLIWELARSGARVEIWTLCAGEIPPGGLTPFAKTLHARWGTGLATIQDRRREDQAAWRELGAAGRFFDLPDCVYRRLPSGDPVVSGEDDLWREIQPGEQALVKQISVWWRAGLRPSVQLVAPLALGGHVDHRLARAAAEELSLPLLYYADYPYALRTAFNPDTELGTGWVSEAHPVSAAGVEAWQRAVAQYTSQISTFWQSLDEMRAAMADYAASRYGTMMWKHAA